ncbi:beta-N-acetylhexosaminidase family protein [Sphingomonas sp. RIT328]|uniref:beta-N-acetylhexosaminidase family protein n=1 Tax=Sphingomonas sp. RIT328 TaxID=1470591 RepID=UPI000452A918|nr:beta-N-acetylglucosaminidase domain-containing protein [Sphingomonas sp. RIT328]EZP53128.1 Beta-N-acetylglucosaminidase family protein [Sphingomonas sp. RIT328]
MMRRLDRIGALAALTAGIVWSNAAAAADPVTAPALFPAPAALTMTGGAVPLGTAATLVVAPGTEPATVAAISDILSQAGVRTLTRAKALPTRLDATYVVIGGDDTAPVRAALARSQAARDDRAEGYTLTVRALDRGALVTLAGHDGDGLFHAVQTLRQLATRPRLPALTIRDHPAMPIRGTIEGFYGKPWTMEDRSRHLAFLATVKANTYVYSPKDDPFARDKWREAYPAATLSALGTLAATARRNHVDFVYAISPGPSICFSDPADAAALEHKFDALRGIGVTSFYVALDDIEYTKWNCAGDTAAFGPSGAQAAGVAQARLLNGVQRYLTAKDARARPLIMVPTEYYDAKETPYKAALRQHLDPRIVVQWTGTDVVPPAISIPDAKAATKAFGRKTLLWDNYPVNDYAQTTGRLLLAPYARREAGLSGELTGILSNPMNQETPSRVAVTGVAAFGWNDTDYDATLTWHAAARALAGGDAQATAALLLFFDTQHIAPTFGSQPWQEQAPQLKALLDHVRETIAGGDAAARQAAIGALAERADALAGAADIIRAGTVDPGFAAQAKPWLDALPLWGRALQLTAAGLAAADHGDAAAPRYFAEARALATQAAAIRTIPGATRFDGPVRIADGVLDRFISDAPGLIAAE